MNLKEPFAVHLHPQINVDIASAWDDLTYEHYTLEEPAQVLPTSIFAAQPIFGKRIVTMHIEADSANLMNFLLEGNLWPYRTKLEAHGVPGAYFEEKDNHDDSTEKRTYYRILREVDVSDTVGKQKVLDMLGKEAFNGLAMRVLVEKEPEDGTHAKGFMDELREMPQLHFKK
jgi:hypothetical protein